MMNTLLYTAGSTIAAFVCIANACVAVGVSGPVEQWLGHLIVYLMSSKIYILVLMNMAYNILFLFGKMTQIAFFGQLRADERNNISDRLLNYILFKIVFVGAVLEPDLAELLVWTSWFSILGFLKIFSLLARDRFEWLVTTMSQDAFAFRKILSLLVMIMISDACWFTFCIVVFEEAGPSVLLLLTFECFTLFLDTVQTLIKYFIHFRDSRSAGDWDLRVTYVYYTELITDSLILVATLGHYLQILYLHGISFTLIDAVLFLHMRLVFNNLREKLTSYRNYRKLAQDMDLYPDVAPDELTAHDDNCAICHCEMTTAKKLPCGHIFHRGCILQWIERSPSCPTCRSPLLNATPSSAAPPSSGPAPPHAHPDNGHEHGETPPTPVAVQPEGGWLRSVLSQFSAGVSDYPVTEEMVASVASVFPHVPQHAIRLDLQRTGSIELTTENILEGRIEVPATPPTPVVATPPAQSTPGRTEPVEESVLEDRTFAATAAERQALLKAKRDAMKAQARRRFEERKKREQETPSEGESEAAQGQEQGHTGAEPSGAPKDRERVEPTAQLMPVRGDIAQDPDDTRRGRGAVTSGAAEGEDTPEMRRRRALEAAERRMMGSG